MRIELRIDNYTHTIDSRDPELLARWLVEQFGAHQWTPATMCNATCWPSFSGGLSGEPERMDWLGDSRYLTYWRLRSPHDLLAAMQRALRESDPS